MATRKQNPNPVYAVANARFEHGYGHLTLHVYNALGESSRSGTIKIDCQAGGTCPGETYSWKYGVSNDYDVLDVHALKKGYWLLRAMKRTLDKDYDEFGSAKTYAEYVVRVLRAAGVRKVHLRPGVNSTFHGDVQTLHAYNPVKNGDALLNELHNMEQAIIGMTS
jgi:hypothetical protein